MVATHDRHLRRSVQVLKKKMQIKNDEIYANRKLEKLSLQQA